MKKFTKLTQAMMINTRFTPQYLNSHDITIVTGIKQNKVTFINWVFGDERDDWQSLIGAEYNCVDTYNKIKENNERAPHHWIMDRLIEVEKLKICPDYDGKDDGLITFETVIEKLHNAGITPDDISILIWPEMYEIVGALEEHNLGLDTILTSNNYYGVKDMDTEEIEHRLYKYIKTILHK